MIYYSIDIETTGLNPETCKILSVGIVKEDTNNVLPLDELPRLHIGVIHDEITGSLFAINMNKNLIESILNNDLSKGMVYLREKDIVNYILSFLEKTNAELDKGRYYINVAGKNFEALDKLFLEKLPGFTKRIKLRRRVLDPAILFVDWKTDNSAPGLGLCKERAKMENYVSHDAIDDALDVITLLRTQYT